MNGKEINDPRVQAISKRSGHKNISSFINSRDYYELPKRTIRAYGSIYHIFKPNSSRDVQNLYQDKASMDMTLKEFEFLTPTCWDEKYRSSTFDITKAK